MVAKWLLIGGCGLAKSWLAHLFPCGCCCPAELLVEKKGVVRLAALQPQCRIRVATYADVLNMVMTADQGTQYVNISFLSTSPLSPLPPLSLLLSHWISVSKVQLPPDSRARLASAAPATWALISGIVAGSGHKESETWPCITNNCIPAYTSHAFFLMCIDTPFVESQLAVELRVCDHRWTHTTLWPRSS